MNYFIYAHGESFDIDNVYHQIEATSPKKAACIFALNEESLYGICNQYYNVFDINGKLITRIDVSDRNTYINTQHDIISPFDLVDGEGINNFEDGNLDKLSETLSANDVLKIENIQFFDTFNDTSININKDIINVLSKLFKPDLDKLDQAYNPIIAREFLRNANFSDGFVKKYGYFIAESDINILGKDNHILHLVITGNTANTKWPTTFTHAEYDQLYNISAVLLACGIVHIGIVENIWQLHSKRWNLAQIATITKLVMAKCKLNHTGMHSDDSDNDHLWEYIGNEDLPNILGFLA